MEPVLQSCQLLLRIVRDLIGGVAYWGCGNGGAAVTDYVPTRAAAERLKAGLRLAEAYLRRVLLVMALELEPNLVDKAPIPTDRRRRGLRKRKMPARYRPFKVLDGLIPPMPDAFLAAAHRGHFRTHKRFDIETYRKPRPVHIGAFKLRLEQLAQIAADPLPRAKRLAFHLARKIEGPIIAPNLYIRPSTRLGRMRRLWSTETSATFDGMAFDIITKSKARPPPLPPIRKYGPSILVVGG